MSPKWLRLAARVLDMAADELSNHGCNDWHWPKDWTAEDRRAFVEQMLLADRKEHSIDELSSDDRQEIEDYSTAAHGPPDWMVARFLATWINEVATRAATLDDELAVQTGQ